jgi:hypothetical protein
MCDVRRQSTMRADRTAGAAITRSNEEPKRSMGQCEWNPPNLRQRRGGIPLRPYQCGLLPRRCRLSPEHLIGNQCGNRGAGRLGWRQEFPCIWAE